MVEQEKRKQAVINAAYYGIIAAGILLGVRIAVRYLLPAMYPFAIAYVISLMLNPLMHRLKRKIGLPKGVGAFLLVAIAVAGVFALAYLAVSRTVTELGRLISYLTALSDEDTAPLKRRFVELLSRLGFSDGEQLWQAAAERMNGFIADSIPGVKGMLAMATGLFTGVLDFLLTFIVTVVSCYYMTVDRSAVSSFFYRICPKSAHAHIRKVRTEVLSALGKYLKAYGIITVITFTELFASFTVLRLDYALLLAAVTALIDILPVLGVGTVLIPWGLVCIFVTGNLYLGIGLIVTYIVITVIRQIIEPKIVGSYIGLHPLATMITMFAGLKLFGVVGMLAFPFSVLCIRNIARSNTGVQKR